MCQVVHWKYHRPHCVTPEERSVATQEAMAASLSPSTAAKEDECPICLDALSSHPTTSLPCNHTFHVSCVEQQKTYGVSEACPSCRAMMPAKDPQRLCDDAYTRFQHIHNRAKQSDGMTWRKLRPSEQEEMNEVMKQFREAADQGHAESQSAIAGMYFGGRGVKEDRVEAAKWYQKAAKGGDAQAQCMLGVMYMHGEGGLKKDLSKALRWFNMAKKGGHPRAQKHIDKILQEQKQEAAANKKSSSASSAASGGGGGASSSTSSSACGNCGAAEASSHCARCKTTEYCGRECQRAHWKTHKKTCAAPAPV